MASLATAADSSTVSAAAGSLILSACTNKEMLIRVKVLSKATGQARKIDKAWIIAEGTFRGVQHSVGTEMSQSVALMPAFVGDYYVTVFVVVNGRAVEPKREKVSGIMTAPEQLEQKCVHQVEIEV